MKLKEFFSTLAARWEGLLRPDDQRYRTHREQTDKDRSEEAILGDASILGRKDIPFERVTSKRITQQKLIL